MTVTPTKRYIVWTHDTHERWTWTDFDTLEEVKDLLLSGTAFGRMVVTVNLNLKLEAVN